MLPKGQCSTCGANTSRKNTRCGSCSQIGRIPWNKELKGYMKVRQVSIETRTKQSVSQLGDKNHMWKGGKTMKSQKRDFRYQDWRNSVIERDGSKCTICSKFCMYPITHHIEHASENESLKYDISNGVTLCYDCHMTVHNKVSYYRKRGEFSGTLRNETILSQSWEETSMQVQRIMAETKELYNSMSVMPTRAPLSKENIYAELMGDYKK